MTATATTEPDTILTRDIEPTDTRSAHYWRSADGQSVLDMSGATLAEARAELLEQCGTDEQRDAMLRGRIAY